MIHLWKSLNKQLESGEDVAEDTGEKVHIGPNSPKLKIPPAALLFSQHSLWPLGHILQPQTRYVRDPPASLDAFSLLFLTFFHG